MVDINLDSVVVNMNTSNDLELKVIILLIVECKWK